MTGSCDPGVRDCSSSRTNRSFWGFDLCVQGILVLSKRIIHHMKMHRSMWMAFFEVSRILFATRGYGGGVGVLGSDFQCESSYFFCVVRFR